MTAPTESTGDGLVVDGSSGSGARGEHPTRPVRRLACRGVDWLRGHSVIAVFWVVAVLIRLAIAAAYRPSSLQWMDAQRFARVGWSTFGDFWAPAGYAGFLAALRLISDQLALVTATQHVLGMVTAGLLAAAAARMGLRRPWNLMAGTVVAFGGDYMFLEHLVMTETLFITAIALGVCAAVRCLEDHNWRWAALASFAFAASALVRGNALVLNAVLPLCLLGGISTLHASWRALVASIAPGAAFITGYVVVATVVGPYTGLWEMNGWHLYSRAAPFADCEQLRVDDQDADIARLCEDVPASQRFGPYHYSWSPDSPARQAWGLDPARSDDLRRFAVDAILRQPDDYLHAVAEDLVRVVVPGFRASPGHGQLLDTFEFDHRDPEVERLIANALAERYSGVRPEIHGAGLATAYQRATRLPGLAVPLAITGALVGLVRHRGARRRQLLLSLLVGSALLLAPIFLLTWDYRYTLPALPFLLLAGLIGCFAERDRGTPIVADGASTGDE